MLCDHCQNETATVFVTKIVDDKTSKLRLCAVCARDRAIDEGWLEGLGDDAAQFSDLPLEEIVMKLFAAADNSRDDTAGPDEAETSEKWSLTELAALDAAGFKPGEFSGDEDAVDDADEWEDGATDDDLSEALNELLAAHNDRDVDAPSPLDSESNPFGDEVPHPSRPIAVARCPKCETTWDRLRQDGRVGCATCYSTFADQINDVMARLQSAQQHIGKAPRAATKRRRRLEHLRARRDHRLALLNERLTQALADEKYEEAAKLRDKIKIVESTIVSKDEG